VRLKSKARLGPGLVFKAEYSRRISGASLQSTDIGRDGLLDDVEEAGDLRGHAVDASDGAQPNHGKDQDILDEVLPLIFAVKASER